MFDLTRRGYDRQQVDEHIRTLHAALADAQSAHQRERRRADWVEGELRNAQSQLEKVAAEGDGAAGGAGFGYRVEKLLRTAEQEAAEVRSSATREATALLERAREDAEAHRHEVEQSLIARTALLEQEATQRKVALDERERQIAEQAAGVRDEAERVLTDVRRQADQILQDARVRAEQERIKAEKGIRDRHEAAEQELARLRSLHDEVRGQLGRLLESLAGEFGGERAFQQQEPAQLAARQAHRAHPRPHPHPTGTHRLVEQDPLPTDQREAREDRAQAAS